MQDSLKTREIQFFPGLAIGGGGGRGQGLGLQGDKGLELADDLLAPPVGIQYLGKKGPKDVGFAENPLATQWARGRGAEMLRGNEFAQTRAQLAEGFLFELSQFGRQNLLGGPGVSAESLKMKVGE